MNTSRHILILLTLPFLFCAAPLQEFYPDSYFTEDGIYQNKPLRFSLAFRGKWNITTDPGDMKGNSLQFARQLQNSHAELLFVGTTVEETQGVRAIAINLNAGLREYAKRIQSLNATDVSEDYGQKEIIIDGMSMVRWDYMVQGFRFVEFFFVLDTYNIRVAFWTKPALFDRFEKVYIDIMSSLNFVDRY